MLAVLGRSVVPEHAERRPLLQALQLCFPMISKGILDTPRGISPGAPSRSTGKVSMTGPELAVSGKQSKEQTRSRPSSVVTTKCRSPKRTSALGTQSAEAMAIHHLVEKMNEMRKVPYLVPQLLVFFSAG